MNYFFKKQPSNYFCKDKQNKGIFPNPTVQPPWKDKIKFMCCLVSSQYEWMCEQELRKCQMQKTIIKEEKVHMLKLKTEEWYTRYIIIHTNLNSNLR
jgi:hypothetical protein